VGVMHEARTYRAGDFLKDGTMIAVRAIRADDRDRIVTAFRKLEPETVYSRFFAFRESLSNAELEQIAAMDFVHDVMLLATLGADDNEIVIGSGNYSTYGANDGTLAAEVAFVVEEDFQDRGVAGRLLAHLTRIARDHGVARFEAEVLAHNCAMLSVFSRSGLPMQRRREGELVQLSMALTIERD
jgi:GNAT superfamily N-acetyltransferase